MSAEAFLDTNIFVYTFDRDDAPKRDVASRLVEDALRAGGCISHQVVHEFLNVATRKFAEPMRIDVARRYLHEILVPLWKVSSTPVLIERALGIHDRWRYGIHDAMIVAAALEAGCRTLYTEDLQHGQHVESLTIVDPFRASDDG